MPKTVLVIDDDLTSVKLMQSRLAKEGFDVAVAIDGEGALQKLESMTPDLILLDIRMPNMDGYTFLLEIRKNPKLNNVPVIVVTSHKDMEPIFKYNGARDYIVKPVDFDVLFKKMKDLGL